MPLFPALLPSPRQRSITESSLLEILVSIALVTIGLLGALNWLHQSQNGFRDRYQRSEALHQAAAMRERLRANHLGALAGDYDGQQMPTACTRPGPEAGRKWQAQYRLCLWQRDLAQTLADGRGMVQTVGGSTRITVSWRQSASQSSPVDNHTLTVHP